MKKNDADYPVMTMTIYCSSHQIDDVKGNIIELAEQFFDPKKIEVKVESYTNPSDFNSYCLTIPAGTIDPEALEGPKIDPMEFLSLY